MKQLDLIQKEYNRTNNMLQKALAENKCPFLSVKYAGISNKEECVFIGNKGICKNPDNFKKCKDYKSHIRIKNNPMVF